MDPLARTTLTTRMRRLPDRLRARAGARARARQRRRDDRGEGVISAAIAVLVMAGIGALMWVGFTQLWQETEDNTRDRVAEIGR